MTGMTPRELLHAFDEGLEEAARNARREVNPESRPIRDVIRSSTSRIVGNTLVGTLRKTYGNDFAAGYRSDTKLGTLLEREGLQNLSQLVGPRSTQKKGRR